MTSLETAVTLSRKLRPRTRELYLQHVRAFLAFLEDRGAKAFTATNALAWRDDMRARRIKAQSVNVALNALRFAARRAKLTFTDEIETLPVRTTAATKKDRPLGRDEARRLLAQCNGTQPRDLRDRAIITLGLRTGMLRFSMCQLDLADFALDTSAPHLTFTKKGGARHTITLDPHTCGALTMWTAWLHARGITTGPLFRSLGRDRVRLQEGVAIGAKLTPDGLYRAIQLRARHANLPDLNPHIFRKTFLAWAEAAGASPTQIAAVTGLKSDAGNAALDVTLPAANHLLPDLV